MSREVKLVEIYPPYEITNLQDADQIFGLHKIVTDTAVLRPDRVQVIEPGTTTKVEAFASDVYVSALDHKEASQDVIAKIKDVPLFIQRIISAGTRRTNITEMPKETTIIPLGKALASDGPSIAAPSVQGMEVSYAIYVPAGPGGQQEELGPTPLFDTPLIPAGIA